MSSFILNLFFLDWFSLLIRMEFFRIDFMFKVFFLFGNEGGVYRIK